jgi:membrane protein DedA with SNARE-associated domain
LTFFSESEILEWLIRHGYLLMFLVMLIEGPAVTAIGALGAALGHFNVFIVFVLSFFANFLPDVLYYSLGHWGGQWVLDRFGARIGIPLGRRERASDFITTHLGKWLLFIKTIPFISPPGLAVMGALGVSIKRFIWWDMAIVALTSAFFATMGYYSGQGYGFLQRAFGYGALWLAGFFILFLLMTFLYNRIVQRFTRRMRQYTDEESPVQQ